ncbi:MAG: extracellular solute-binding protein [Deltaproteobacteria bacterium]|nr:extracellular solute-binding protein [Deltaproteobacteria bacterium]
MKNKDNMEGHEHRPRDSFAPIDRRSFIKQTAAAAAVFATASIGPWFIRNALSSSGTLNLFTWQDYSKPEVISAFESATGIKVNVTNYGSNPLTEFNLHMEYDLYQKVDKSRIPNLGNVIETFYKKSKILGGVIRGKHVGLPYDWGTEAVAWNTDKYSFKYGELSFGTMWEREYKHKATCRPHSVFLGAGLYLDSIGKVPSNRMYDTYHTQTKMRKVYDQILKFLLKHKKNVKMFWNNFQDHLTAFEERGCLIGQTWDGPMLNLKKEGKPFSYMAPKEGALCWVDSMAIVKNAKNIEQAYAFINWAYTPEVGAIMAKATGYNSVVKGAADLLDDAIKKGFAEAYPGDALDNLWWYPSEPTYFVSTRNEYKEKYLAAFAD